MEKGKGTIVQGNSQVDSPHYEFLRSCAGCTWAAILHLGCVVDGDVREAPIPNLTEKKLETNKVIK